MTTTVDRRFDPTHNEFNRYYGTRTPEDMKDAFGRLRISDPVTLFDSQSEYDKNPLLWNEKIVGFANSQFHGNTASVVLNTSTASGDRVIRQTRQYFRYQPGHSQEILMTFVMCGGKGNMEQKIGYFDDQNGIFLKEENRTVSFVRRSYVTGTAIDTVVPQSSWNVDTMDGNGGSKINIDWTKAQILVMDLEWLGVGRVRVGFNIDGQTYVAHEFLHANAVANVYMTTANLPLRYEIENTDATSNTSHLRTICSSVISEGGFEEGRGYPFVARRQANTIVANSTRPILSIRPKETFNEKINRGTIILSHTHAMADIEDAAICIVYDAELTNSNFQSVSNNSIVEWDVQANAMTGGHVVDTYYLKAGGQGSGSYGSSGGSSVLLRLPLSLDIDGNNATNFTISATGIGGGSTVTASIHWQEIR